MNAATTKTGTPWTIGGLLDWTARYLAERGSEFPRLDAEVLLAHSLECRRIDLYTRYDQTAPEVARAKYRGLIRNRLEGCPVAYLVGKKEFFSLTFDVSPSVLIPRPESEFVVLECLRLAKPIADPRIIDIGTGSGNIAAAVASQLPSAQITAVDISRDALRVAALNAARLGVAKRIQFVEGDLFSEIPPQAQYHFVLSNPPYIAREDLNSLPAGVKDYEPQLALDGGPGGYAVFDRLIDQGRRHLLPGGHLIVEIGSPQETPARERICAYPEYELADTIFDGSRHPRVLCARRRL